MNIYDIHTALSTRLVALQSSGVPPIAAENTGYTPVKGTLWLEESIIPAGNRALGTAASDADIGQGVYQVTVHAPADKMRKTAQEQADAIANQFPKTLELTSDSKTVKIRRVEINQGVNVGAWYSIPVSIYYETIQ